MHTTGTPPATRTPSAAGRPRRPIRAAAAAVAALTGIAALAGVAACGTGPVPENAARTDQGSSSAAPAPPASARRPTGPVDRLVGPVGARVHVRCVGHGATTVLLISGFGGDTTGWAEVEPVVAGRARVCSSDRPGTGTSDPATSTATFTSQAAELHRLLGEVG